MAQWTSVLGTPESSVNLNLISMPAPFVSVPPPVLAHRSYSARVANVQGEPSFLAHVSFQIMCLHSNTDTMVMARGLWDPGVVGYTHRDGQPGQREKPQVPQSPTEVRLPPHACFPKEEVFSVVTAGFWVTLAYGGSFSLSHEALAFMESATDSFLLQIHH